MNVENATGGWLGAPHSASRAYGTWTLCGPCKELRFKGALSRARHGAADYSAQRRTCYCRPRTHFGLATSLPARRLEFRVGKMGLVDFFDTNTYGTDSHLQFLNWTVDNNGAYDYAANTRGYTDAAIIEYDDHWFTATVRRSDDAQSSQWNLP